MNASKRLLRESIQYNFPHVLIWHCPRCEVCGWVVRVPDTSLANPAGNREQADANHAFYANLVNPERCIGDGILGETQGFEGDARAYISI